MFGNASARASARAASASAQPFWKRFYENKAYLTGVDPMLLQMGVDPTLENMVNSANQPIGYDSNDSNDDESSVVTSKDASGSGAGSPYGGSSPVTYSDWSPAAKMFGMDRSTAYEEHLANTAHQREVADLRAAGLNPVLGLSSGAPTVSGSYVGGSGYGSSAKKTSFKNIADVIGSIAGMIVLAKSKNKYAGSWTASMTSKAFSQAGKLLDDVLE